MRRSLAASPTAKIAPSTVAVAPQRDWSRWLEALTPLAAARKPALVADIRGWYAEAPNGRVGRAELQVIDPQLIYKSGPARLFEAADGRVLQLSVETTPIDGWMIADWLAQDGLSHHAFALRAAADGRLVRHFARGEKAERSYHSAPLADGWYTFAVDQSGRLLVTGAAAGAAGKTRQEHRELVGALPGLFFGELYVISGRAIAFNNRAVCYATAPVLAEQAKALVPALSGAQFLPWNI